MSSIPPAPEPQGSQPAYQPPTPGDSAPPPVAPQYPAGSYPAPPVEQPTAKTKGPGTLGVVAFLVSLVAITAGSILGYVAGSTLGGLAQYGTVSSDGTYVLDSLPAAAESVAATGGVLTFVTFAVFGVLALWGFVQGIVAAVKNRGRGWAIAAIILAVIGGIFVFIAFTVGAGVGAAPYVA